MSGKALKEAIRLNQKMNRQHIEAVIKASEDTKRRKYNK